MKNKSQNSKTEDIDGPRDVLFQVVGSVTRNFLKTTLTREIFGFEGVTIWSSSPKLR